MVYNACFMPPSALPVSKAVAGPSHLRTCSTSASQVGLSRRRDIRISGKLGCQSSSFWKQSRFAAANQTDRPHYAFITTAKSDEFADVKVASKVSANLADTLELTDEVITDKDDYELINSAPEPLSDEAFEFDNPPWECPYPDGRITFEEQARIAKIMEKEIKYQRLVADYEKKKLFGFSPNAEVINARVAMFFFIVALITEKASGASMLEQIGLIFQIFTT
eukprot:CAMPEP_0196653948 /NCGR_PEP_ID=MMETSP1086-20130531/3614_1 /TAXON_ID=77921 /ORGANISM="Cyanoptyche  gloeocystis , Strain SAG4.97" /LENGTH=221 /DNA_ID=CAMNT_0041985411 /DNA_START=121 /DNA_END=786 /DNA_ORIENTATION=+